MRKALASLLALPVALLAPSSRAVGGEVELTGSAGYTYPFYSQTFTYDPGPIVVPIPGVSIQQSGVFDLKASGSPAFAGALAFYPSDTIGVELRLDSAGLSVKTQDSTFDVNMTLPAPLAPVKSTITLTNGEASVDAARPFSLNLKVRSSGRARFFVSGGISHIGDLGFSLRQSVSLGVVDVDLVTQNLHVGTIDLRASRRLETTGSRWGGNLGLGIQLPLGEHGGLVLEGRGFYFPEQTAEWDAIVETPLGQLEKQLLSRLLDRLDPVRFRPWWVQGTIGVSYRF